MSDHDQDQLFLDACATDIRATLALLKARIVDRITDMSSIGRPRGNWPREIDNAFSDAVEILLEASVDQIRVGIPSADTYAAETKAYFRELARDDS